ncbi:MAG: efflux RND transporter periplasmic adaptor subunit [Candidatus Riflebacteria bacterium]|nr:efflux RND transporter periplasmic adaptor subunit [Candidatus Riflebacteria bacterium]
MSKLKLFIPLLIVGIGFFLYSEVHGVNSDNKLLLSGNFEIDDVVVSFRIPGLILERLVDEGESVASGALIAKLDSSEYRIAVERASAIFEADKAILRELENGARVEEKQQALAQLQMAQAVLKQLEAGSRPQELDTAKALRSQAEAQVKKAQASLAEATKNEKRFAKLLSENAISEQDHLDMKTRADVAKANHNDALARLEAARQQLSMTNEGVRKEEIEKAKAVVNAASATFDLIIAGPRQEKIQQAKAKSEASEASLKQALLSLSFTELEAPMAGTILAKAAEAGEFVKQGQPVVTIGNLQNIFLRVYVSETKLGLVKIGQPVKINVDTYPNETFSGKVSFISQEAEFTPKNVQTHEERVKLVYRVKISVNNPDQKLKPGMPADALMDL